VKLNILSDLHLSCGALDVPRTDADIVILAGDIARPREAIAWARDFPQPVLLVPGNHEFYGSSIAAAPRLLKQLSAGTNVHVLDNDEITIKGVRFLGSTLWTDYSLSSDATDRALAMQEALAFIRDFSVIDVDGPKPRRFTPEDAVALCRTNTRWLAQRLAEPQAGPTVVITHHAPSSLSVHARFAGSRLNGCFVSDLAYLLDGRRAQLWVHGHTHDRFDYLLHGTRVVCNPRGYAKDGVNENPEFDAHFVVCVEAMRRNGALAQRTASLAEGSAR
jgi:predicted phosphodiesterase